MAGVCSSCEMTMRLLSMLLASNSLSMSFGTPLPAVPTFRRSPCSCVKAVSVAVAVTLRAESAR